MVKLEVIFEEYERYEGGPLCKYTIQRDDLLEALKVMCEELEIYNISEEIEEGTLNVDDVLNCLCESNGDGCSYIFSLKDLVSSKVYMNNIKEKDL